MAKDKTACKYQAEQGEVERTSKGQFAPGVSGNPAGRPRASVNALLAQAREAAAEILPQIIEQARNGDIASQEMLLKIGMPKVKPMPDKMAAVPGFPYEASPRKQQAYIMGAMAGGMISVDEARLYLDAIAGTNDLPSDGIDLDLNFDNKNELPQRLKGVLEQALRQAQGGA